MYSIRSRFITAAQEYQFCFLLSQRVFFKEQKKNTYKMLLMLKHNTNECDDNQVVAIDAHTHSWWTIIHTTHGDDLEISLVVHCIS